MSWTHERARIATLTRSRGSNDPELVEARAKLRSELLIARVERLVTEAPALDARQFDRLTEIIDGVRPSE